MHPTSRLKAAGLALPFVGPCAVAGGSSGAEPKARIKGKVKFFDKNLTAGSVTFMTEDGRVGTGIIDFDGNYEVTNAPVGECKILVKVPQVPPATKMGKKFNTKPPPGMPPM